jgi:hypothetical protein
MGKHNSKGNPFWRVFWLVVIVVGLAILLGWNPLGLDTWEWPW